MSGLFDAKPLKITCPKCSHKLEQPVRRLKNAPKLTCPSCGATITVKAEGLRKALKSADKGLADLKRSFSKLGK